MKILFFISIYNFTKFIFNNILNFINHNFKIFISYITYKTIVLFCTLSYLIFFLIFTYLSYKVYLYSLEKLTESHSMNMTKDIAKLIYNYPLL